MGLRRTLLFASVLSLAQAGWTQSPTYGLGRTPSAEEIRAWDIAISPTGKELPPGQGTAKEGAVLYVQKGVRGMPRGSGIGRPCAHADRAEGDSDAVFVALSCALRKRR